MHIYYNCKTQKWEHDDSTIRFLGKNRLKTVQNTELNLQHSIPFLVKRKGDQLGPVIGILCSKGNRGGFSGNEQLFLDIQRRLEKTGGISFVFTPEGIQGQQIKGYYYYHSQWIPLLFPIPDFIYNRIRNYQDETLKVIGPVKKLIHECKVPYFNPHFFHKWNTYLELSEESKLQAYLPATAHLNKKDQLCNWVEVHNEVYLKPVLSNRGKGIFLLSKEDRTFVVRTNSMSYSFERFDDLWNELNLDMICHKYIIQRKVTLLTFEGSPYDYRVLVQRIKNDWFITGIGVRCAKEEGIMTHIPNGGTIIPIEDLTDPLTNADIEHLVQLIATRLEKAYGYIGEFSIDIGKDVDGNLWIFEVNSKPMKFDEPHIYSKAMETLISCFYDETLFS